MVSETTLGGRRRIDAGTRILVDALRAELEPGWVGQAIPDDWAAESWKQLLADAEWHRVAPALSNLESIARCAPDWVADEIRTTQLEFFARRMMVDDARARATRILTAAGVPVIALKGSALVELVYDTAQWRDMSDVDLLVPPDRVAEARAVLIAAGYRQPENDPAGLEGELPHADAPLLDAGGVVPIELHRHFLDGHDARRWPIADVWSRALPSNSGDHLVPSTVDLLLHVCMHFMSNRHVRSEGALAQVRDIAWIARRPDVDWRVLEHAARRYGMIDRISVALGVVWHLELIETCPVQCAAPPEDEALAAFVRHQVLRTDQVAPAGSWHSGLRFFRDGLWWARRSFADAPSGARAADPIVNGRALASRRKGLSGMVVHLLNHAPSVAADRRTGRWLRSLN